MTKKWFFYRLVLLILILVLLASVLPLGVTKVEAAPAIIYVPDDYSTIQAAVVGASPGDTIIVRDGTYTENVDVDKSVTIRSEGGADSTIVQAASPDDHVFEVTADYMNIQGFIVKGATGSDKAGIYLDNVDHCEISNNIILNNKHGIHLNNSSYNDIHDNTVKLCSASGIFLDHSPIPGPYLPPVGHNNPGIKCTVTGKMYYWQDEALAYDGDINTYAKVYVGDIQYGPWLELFAPPTQSQGIRCWLGPWINYGGWPQVELFYDGTWNSLKDWSRGSSTPPVPKEQWVEIDYPEKMVEKARFRYGPDNIGSRGNGQLHEFQFKTTLGISSSNNDIVQNNISNNGAGVRLYHSSDNRIYLNNFINNTDNGYSEDSSYICNSPEEITYTYNCNNYTNHLGNYWNDYAAYLLPVGHNNPGTIYLITGDTYYWQDEALAYDGNIETYAKVWVGDIQYGPWLELFAPPKPSQGIRFWLGPWINYGGWPQVELFYDGTWNLLKDWSRGSSTPPVPKEQWVEIDYPEKMVEKARFRYGPDNIGSRGNGQLHEFQFKTASSDADGDGIWDTPYTIDRDKDSYPLTEPFENYSIGGGSSGTEEDPYKIYDVYDLQAMNDDLTAYYELANDIDATETKDWNDGEGFLPIGQTGPFQGHFDGKGHKIKNLYVNAEGKFPEGDIRNNHGLFTELGSSAVVKNVGLEDIFIHHGWETGFAHYHMKSGAIAGLSSGSISCCWATGEIQEWGTSTPPGSAHNCAGGLVGENSGNICNSFAQGTVRAAGGGNQGGGITGVNKVDGHICCCYAACSVDAYPSEAGISGINEGTVEKSYWNIDLTPKSAGGIGKITLQMKLKVTYVDWDFENIWDIVGNETYPLLRVFEVSPGVTPPTFSGSGTELSPYLIYNVVDLQNVVGDLEAWYELPNDIDAEETENWNDGQGFVPIGQTGAFQGHLDGRGHKIKKLYINLDAHERRFPEGDIRNNQGLFNELGENADVKNLGLEDVYINREAGTGFAIRTERAGAIAGISKGSIYCCWATGEIRVHGTSTPPGSAYNYAGGLVSENHGGIFNSFTQGTVTVYGGSDRAGGIVGTNGADGHICCCYATCKVNVYPYDVGGISYCNEGLIEKSYWNIDLTPKSEGGEGKTTGQMKSKTTYVDWDFDTIWDIEDGVTCPFLRVFQVGLDTTPPAAVTDLAVTESTANSITLAWTAPGDDGNIGSATTYDIRYSTSEITTEMEWDSATQATGEPAPQPAGSSESFVVNGLSPETTYYFAIKTSDEAGNESGLSNVVIVFGARPVITSPLVITPSGPYYIGDIITATFTIKNDGDMPIILSTLTVGGRDPDGLVVDFQWEENVYLDPHEEHIYVGMLVLPFRAGDYHFFCAYQRPDGTWNPSVNLGPGMTDNDRIEDITVGSKHYLIGVPHKGRGGIVIPEELFPEGMGEVIPIFVPSVVDDSNAVFENGDWQTIREIEKARFDFDWIEFLASLNVPGPPGNEHVNAPTSAVFSLISGTLISAAQASSLTTLKVTVQESSQGDLRAILQIADVDANTSMRSLAGKGWQFLDIEPSAAHCILISKPIYKAFHLDPSCDYTIGLRVDSAHEDDEYIGYLSFTQDNKLTFTPKIYSADGFKVVLRELIGYDEIFQLDGDGYLSLFERSLTGQMATRISKILASVSILVVSEPGLLSKVKSPVELRVYDYSGNVTGIVSGEIIEEIPNSFYSSENDAAIILSPASTTLYNFEVVGIGEGTYGLEIYCLRVGEVNTLAAVNIPTLYGSVHKYTIDWNALSQGQDGVTVDIDANDDGVFEQTITADATLEPPVAVAGGPYEGDEGSPITFNGTASYDADGTIDLYEWDVNGDDIYELSSASPIIEYTYGDDFTGTVNLRVTDDEGLANIDEALVTVNNVPPDVTADLNDQAVQYSDYISDVTFNATDVAADMMTASTSFSVDGGGFMPGLPEFLAFMDNGCSASPDTNNCTWTLEGIACVPAGDYTVCVTVEDDDGGQTDADITITVDPEDATVAFDAANEVAVPVDTPGGDSGLFSLIVYVTETVPDLPEGTSAPGDISLADVSMSLVPVGPGSSASPDMCTASVLGTAYDGVLTLTCDFDNVPVNTYSVMVTVDGGYYTGTSEDVLVVYDPSLGFATGGGWFYWPDTDEKTNFGFNMKYNKKGTRVQGSLLLIRHLADGTIYRIKSNSLYGLALGESTDPTFGWASFSGKATYKEPSWLEPEGNYEFVTYVEDRNEPGNGYDQFWIEVKDKDRNTVIDISMLSPASENTVMLDGGNIVVPHR